MHVMECPLNGTHNIDVNISYPNPCHHSGGLNLSAIGIIFSLINASVHITRVADNRTNAEGFPIFSGCVSVTNTTYFTRYPSSVIWQRLTNWKLPLLQLFFLVALPAVSKWHRALVLSRVLGNPIATIQDLLLKLSDCQHRAQYWQSRLRDPNLLENVPRRLVYWKTNRNRRGGIVGTTRDNECALSERMQENFVVFKEWEVLWKSITIIVISYQEFGVGLGDKFSNGIEDVIKIRGLGEEPRFQVLEKCHHTAEALAADRYTTLVPIAAAQVFFILAIATPFIQIRTSPPITPGVFLNIEAYSIAFSLMFFWMVFTTFLSAIVGVSQSRDRIPRILNRFLEDLKIIHQQIQTKRDSSECQNPRTGADRTRRDRIIDTDTAFLKLFNSDLTLPNLEVDNAPSEQPEPEARRARIPQAGHPTRGGGSPGRLDKFYSGRIPSWQPGRWNCELSNQDEQTKPAGLFKIGSGLLAVLIVTFSCAMGLLLASEVPPEGFECRRAALLSMWLLWLLSYLLSFDPIVRFFSWPIFSLICTVICTILKLTSRLLNHIPYTGPLIRAFDSLTNTIISERPFWYDYSKDTLVALSQSVVVVSTQCGILNSCACYTRWGAVPLPLSTIPSVADELYHKFSTTFAYITFFTILGFYIFFPGAVLLYYRDAARVFLQKDDGRPHFECLQKWRFGFYKRCVEKNGWLYRRLYRGLYVRKLQQHTIRRADTEMVNMANGQRVRPNAPVGD